MPLSSITLLQNIAPQILPTASEAYHYWVSWELARADSTRILPLGRCAEGRAGIEFRDFVTL
jgi:hypothetical protein